MRDEIYDRNYQAGRAELHAGIDHFVDAIAHVFRRLAAIQFEAPWRKAGYSSAPAVRAVRHRVLLLIGVALASGTAVATALVPFALA